MSRIISYPEVDSLNTDDFLIVDGTTGGTRKIKPGSIIDSTPTQGSTNAVSSGGVYSALHDTDTTLSQSGQSADAKVVGDKIGVVKTDLSIATGYSETVLTPTDTEPYVGYWARNVSTGKMSIAPTANYNTVENPIDISGLAVGSMVTVLASVTSSYGAFIFDKNYIALEYVNGSNAEEKGYVTGSNPQTVTMIVPENAKYIASDIRSTKYTGMSDFNVQGYTKTKIEEQGAEIVSLSQYSDVMSKSLDKGYEYIYPNLEVGQITITTDSGSAWTYVDNTQYLRTKNGYTVHLYPGDVVGLDDYSDGAVFSLGFRLVSGAYSRAMEQGADFTVASEGDYIIVLYQNPKVIYANAYDIGKRLFIRRGGITEKPYKRINKYPLKGIGHRGYVSEGAPENTIWAYRAAKTKGFHYVETDVAWTSDDVAVLLHDPTINRVARNADGSQIAETINIRDITYAQALTYDFGIWKGEQYAGTKIMTVKELLIFCRANDMFPYFELKANVGFSEANIISVLNDVRKYNMLDSCAFISFSYGNLMTVTKVAPSVKVGRLHDGTFVDSIKSELLMLKTRYNTVMYDAYASTIAGDENSIVEFCEANDIVLGIAMTNDLSVITNANDYITECCSEVYVFEKVISDREMGLMSAEG